MVRFAEQISEGPTETLKMTDQTVRARLLAPKSDDENDDKVLGFSTFLYYKDNCSLIKIFIS